MQKFYLLSNKYFFYLLLFVMVFVPLYPKFPLLNIPGTYVAIRIEDFLVAILVLIWLVVKREKLKQFIGLTIVQAILLFWFIGGLSYFSALTVTHSVAPMLGLLHWMRRVEYMFPFIIAFTGIKSIREIKIILRVFLAATISIVLYGFGQQWLHLPVISTTNREFSKGLILYLTPDARVNSTFAGHYDLAVYLSFVLVILGSLFFRIKELRTKVFLILFGLLNFALLGLTAARVSFAATLVGLILDFWIIGKRWLIVGLILLSVLAVGLIPELRHRLVATITVSILGGGGPKYTPSMLASSTPSVSLSSVALSATGSTNEKAATISPDIAPGEPINPTELGVYRSSGIRFNVEWPRAIRALEKNPFLGTGYSSLTIATDNDFLRSLGEVGILGTAALSLIFMYLLKEMLIFIKKSSGFEKNLVVGVLGATVGVLITGLFIDALEASKVAIIFWFMLGCIWAIIKEFKDV